MSEQTIPTSQATSIENLRLDPDNPRKHYDEEALTELKASIRAMGILQNLTAIPAAYDEAEMMAGKDPQAHVVKIGNRRLTASLDLCADLREEIAEIEEDGDGDELDRLTELLERCSMLPVVFLDAEQAAFAMEIQLVENLQRADLDPLEEAEGYRWLMDHKESNPAEIAQRIGKDPEHVRQRLKIILAPAPLLKALSAGKVGGRVCEMVGRIPTEADRKEASARILNPKFKDVPLNQDEARELIRSEFMRNLRGASFDPEDRSLGSACSTCEFRAGNISGVDVLRLGQVGSSFGVHHQTCTDPACFREKEKAAFNALAADSGSDTLPEEEAEKVFSAGGGEIAFDSEWVDLKASPSDRETGHFSGDVPTWSRITKGLGIEPTFARNPHTGKTVQLIRREVAIDAANARAADGGIPSPFENRPDRGTEEARKEKQREEREAKRNREKLTGLGLERLVVAMLNEGIDRDSILALISVQLQEDRNCRSVFMQWFGIKPSENEIGEILLRINSNEGARVENLLPYLAAAILAPGMAFEGIEDEHFKALAHLYSVNVSGDPDPELKRSARGNVLVDQSERLASENVEPGTREPKPIPSGEAADDFGECPKCSSGVLALASAGRREVRGEFPIDFKDLVCTRCDHKARIEEKVEPSAAIVKPIPTLRDLVEASGLSQSTVQRKIRLGAPRDSIEKFKAWLADN